MFGVSKKKEMLSKDRVDFIHKCRVILFTVEPILVVTKRLIKPELLFAEYFDVMKITIDKGLVSFKVESELTMEDIEGNFIEFN